MTKIVREVSKEEWEALQAKEFYKEQANEKFYRTTAIRRFWRPAMAWLYFLICAADFIVYPSLIFYMGGTVQWDPITLKGGGLFHLAMGGIVGITAWSRSFEKLATYRYDKENYNNGYNYGYDDPYVNPTVPYPGSSTRMMPKDNIGDGISSNEDEIIPPSTRGR